MSSVYERLLTKITRHPASQSNQPNQFMFLHIDNGIIYVTFRDTIGKSYGFMRQIQDREHCFYCD